MIFAALLSSSALWISTVRADDDTWTGCTDVAGMDACMATYECNRNYIDLDCNLRNQVDHLVCYLEHCWNKIYSCDYQLLVGGIVDWVYNPVHDTPKYNAFPCWPAPTNAPGGCACNIGEIFHKGTAAVEQMMARCGSLDTQARAQCRCCGWSSVLSAFYGVCPGFDPSNYAYYGLSGLWLLARRGADDSCDQLSSSVCLGQFGFGSADHGVYLDPSHLPSYTSKPLSTTAGSGPLTTPPAGEIITATLLSKVYTISAAPYNAANAAATPSSSGGVTMSSSGGTESVIGTGTGASPSPSNSASRCTPLSLWVLFLLVLL